MSRLQVYLPDDIHAELKARGLSPSELLRSAVVAEVRRQDKVNEAEAYLAELLAEVGQPTKADQARAASIAETLTSASALTKVG